MFREKYTYYGVLKLDITLKILNVIFVISRTHKSKYHEQKQFINIKLNTQNLFLKHVKFYEVNQALPNKHHSHKQHIKTNCS